MNNYNVVTKMYAHNGLEYFRNSKGWWVDARDTYVKTYYWCETEADCVRLIDVIRDEEMRRDNGTAAVVKA